MNHEPSKRSGRFAFSESEMADAFERLLLDKRSLPGIGRLTKVFREIDCQRGRPDFVALSHGSANVLRARKIIEKSSGSLVLSLLHRNSPRTVDYLCRASGMTRRTVERAVNELVERKYIYRTESGSLLINADKELRDIEVWAFELKLDKPKRAVFQAQQYRLFAQNVLIVTPPDQVCLYQRFEEAMRRWGIGLASFDPTTLCFVIHAPARSGSAESRQHQAYALFQLININNLTTSDVTDAV